MWLPTGYSLCRLWAYPWEGCLKLKCTTCAREVGVGNWTLGPACILRLIRKRGRDAKLIDWLD